MKILTTVQTDNKLNSVVSVDAIGPGGANHTYAVYRGDLGGGVPADEEPFLTLHFQKGPRNDVSSVPGILDEDLLEIVKNRLEGFQAGPFACEANAIALNHITAALMALNERTRDRAARGVLGTNQA